MNNPSATHTVGSVASKPILRNASGQSCRRSMPTARRLAAGTASRPRIVWVLKSITWGWSISYTVVPAGHHSRYGRASSPDASITACRIPARHASVRKLSKNRVRTAKRSVSKANPLLSPISLRASSPLATLVKKSLPTALTNGSAKGSLINPARCASALAVATKVAVVPTLVSGPQVSLSVRAMVTPAFSRALRAVWAGLTLANPTAAAR